MPVVGGGGAKALRTRVFGAQVMLSRLLFESRWLLIPALIGVLLAVIWVWSWRRTRGSARAVFVWLGLAPLLVLAQSVVVTPRERITRLCRELAGAVEAGDIAGIRERLAPGFVADGYDKTAFLTLVADRLTRYDVDRAEVFAFDVTFPERRVCASEFYASCRVRTADVYADRVRSRWRLGFTKRGGRWLVTTLEVVSTPSTQPRHASLRGLLAARDDS